MTAHTIVGVQHQQWTVVISLRRHGHNLLSKNTVTRRPARGTRQHRTPATPPKAFHKESSHTQYFPEVDKACVDVFGGSQDFSKIGWRVEICYVVLRVRRKPRCVSSSFASILLPYPYLTNLAYTLPGRLSKEILQCCACTPVSLIVYGDDQFANLSVPF